jgi:hypothetical protein
VLILGFNEKDPPSILYSTLNPDTEATAGRVNMEAQASVG